MSRHGYDILFLIFNNASNAGLPSLAKTKFWRKEQLNEKTGNKCPKQYFIWIALFIIEPQKCEVVGYHFIEFFSVWRLCLTSNESKWFTPESFVSLFIQDDDKPKSSRQLPRIHPAHFAGSWRLTTTLVHRDSDVNPAQQDLLYLQWSNRNLCFHSDKQYRNNYFCTNDLIRMTS